MSRVRGIAQRMHGVTIDRIIPLFSIASLDHKRCPGVKSRYLLGDTALVNCNLLQISGLLSSKETRQQVLCITAIPPSTTIVNRVSNINSQNERPVPSQHQPTTQSSNIPYPLSRGVPWKCIASIIREDKSCPGCHFNHPEDSPKFKFHQEVGCPALAKHGYLRRKDVTTSSKIVDNINTKFPHNTDPDKFLKRASKRVSYNYSSDQISARHVHSPSISNTTIDSTISPDSINNLVLLMSNRVSTPPTSNGYNDLYSSDSEDDPVFE